jgi:hypothetical protein
MHDPGWSSACPAHNAGPLRATKPPQSQQHVVGKALRGVVYVDMVRVGLAQHHQRETKARSLLVIVC